MAAAATSTAPLVPAGICSSTTSTTLRRPGPNRISFAIPNLLPIKSYERALPVVRASNSPGEEANAGNRQPEDPPPFLSPEDLDYLVELGAGSVIGAAAIKYGSVVFPEITKPNITQALLTIFFPVIVAVLLLIRQSRSQRRR